LEKIVIAIGSRLKILRAIGLSSRDNFADGALRAAQWLAKQKPGLYGMQDVLGVE
jgi:4-hydroxy-tetrahydrodipicolinate reductase